MTRRTISYGLILGALLVLWTQSTPAEAQGALSKQENIELRPGSIFEIYAETNPGAETNWILSKGRTFLQANRGSLFNMRPTEVAEFFLNGEVAEQDATSARSIFRIQTSQDAPLTGQSGEEDEQNIVSTFPAVSEDGMVRLLKGSRLIRLDIINSEIEQIALDLNMEEDRNVDGDTFNDNILENSIFALGRGSLHIWLNATFQKQTILVAARLKSGALTLQQIEVVSELYEKSLEDTAAKRMERMTIDSELLEDGTYAFSINTVSGAIAVPTLYRWDFGDGTQSLLDAPGHQFPEKGTYTVQLSISNAATGEEILRKEKKVSVEKVSEGGEVPVDKDSGKKKKDKKKKDSAKAGSIVATLIKAIVLLAISIGVGILVVFLISKLKGASLQKSLEDAENKLVGDKPGDEGGAPPMELKSEDSTEEEEKGGSEEKAKAEAEVVEKAEAKAEEPKEEAPQKEPESPAPAAEEKVPSWLAPSKETSGTPEPEAPPPPPVEPKQEAPTPEPKPEPPAPSGDAPVPAWLQGAPKEPAAQESPTAPPAQEEKPATPPPAPPSADTPAWLAGADKKTEPAPKKTEEPAPKQTKETPPKAKTTDAAAPPWLQGAPAESEKDDPPAEPGLSPGTRQAPPPPPPAPPAAKEAVKTDQATKEAPPQKANKDALPPWLAAGEQKKEQPKAEAPSSPTPQKTDEKPKPAVEPSKPQATEPALRQAQGGSGQAVTQENGDMTKEERERDRKRKKRQRYRANKRKREQEANGNGQAQQKPAPALRQAQDGPGQAPESSGDAPVPPWLKGSPSTPSEAPKKEEGDDDVKFVISADSIEEQKAPKKEDHMPPEGEIPQEEKKGE